MKNLLLPVFGLVALLGLLSAELLLLPENAWSAVAATQSQAPAHIQAPNVALPAQAQSGAPATPPSSAASIQPQSPVPTQAQNVITGPKTAVILVAEGSERADSRRAFLDFEAGVRQTYPNLPVLRAYTSPAVRDIVRGTREEAPSLAGALSIVADTGYTRALILPALSVPDQNYADIRNTAAGFTALPTGLAAGLAVEVVLPLIGSEDDAYTVSAALMDYYPSESRGGDAVLFVGPDAASRRRDSNNNIGSGLHTQADSLGSMAYPALSWGLFRQGKRGSLYLAAFLGNPESLKDCLNILKINKIRNVQLVPLLPMLDDEDYLTIFGRLPRTEQAGQAGLAGTATEQSIAAGQTGQITQTGQAAQTGSAAGQPGQTGQTSPAGQAGQIAGVQPGQTPFAGQSGQTPPTGQAGQAVPPEEAPSVGQADLPTLKEQSVAATLIREGFTVTPRASGLLSNPAMTAIWRAKLQQHLKR